MPLRPVVNVREEVVFHVAEEFNLHDVDLRNVDSRDFGPGLVRICVVVQEFIAQHQGNGQKPIFTSRFAFDRRIEFLQTVNK